MNLQKSTLKKIEEINELVREGKTKEDIIKLKFKQSPKTFQEWMDKFGKYVDFKLERDDREIEEFEVHEDYQLMQRDKFASLLTNEINIDKFCKLLEASDDLLALLDKKDDDVEDVLYISAEFIKEHSTNKLYSFRLNEELIERLNQLCADNKQYNKNTIMNYMLNEFVKKYKY